MTDCPSCAALAADRDHWRRRYETERRYRTLGGTPLKVGETWDNHKIEVPVSNIPTDPEKL